LLQTDSFAVRDPKFPGVLLERPVRSLAGRVNGNRMPNYVYPWSCLMCPCIAPKFSDVYPHPEQRESTSASSLSFARAVDTPSLV